MKKQLKLTVGAPRSGKDTWADNFIKENSGWVKVNRDAIRQELYGPFLKWSDYKFTKEKEKTVTECQFAAMYAYAEEGLNIISTDTNLNSSTVNKFIEWAEMNDYEISYQLFDVPLHILERRNADAPMGVSPEVLVDMWMRFNKKYVEQYTPDEKLPQAIIVDIDGTIAAQNDRSPYDLSKVITDLPRKNIVDIVSILGMIKYDVILLSGRDSVCRDDTIAWLEKNHIQYDELLMRKEKDDRPDYIIKKELFNSIKNKYCIKFAIDDRDQIVNLWRSIGLECLQVNYGKF